MDKAAAEREAIRLWHNLPVQDRLTRGQASAFAHMIAPTIDFGEPDKRAKLIESWIAKELPRTDAALTLSAEGSGGQPRLAPPAWPQREGASAIAFVISLLIMIARRPDIVADARLWAEDGAVWFADAYNFGPLAPLLTPHAGYLQLFPRLSFAVAAVLPLQAVPAFAVWVGLLLRAALPAFVFSSRFSWIDWRAKVAVTAYFLLMPNLAEVHANIQNTSWYLGLYLLAVVLADPPRSRRWHFHDWVVLLIAGTTGPLVLFLLPCLALRTLAQRGTPAVRLSFAAVALALSTLQLILLLLSDMTAGALSLAGTDAVTALQIFASRVALGFLTPARWSTVLGAQTIALPVVAAAAAIIVAVLVRGNWKARGVGVIAPLIVLAALYTPILGFVRTQWRPLLGIDEPGYYVVTNMAWASTLIFFAALLLPRLSSFALAAIVGVCGFLILFEFTLPPVQGPAFGQQVQLVQAARVGETVVVPISPPGWQMALIKH